MTTFRTASETDVSLILDWAAAEGWNPGLDDAAAFYASDPSGFFVAFEGDEPVAAISVVNHTDDFAFLGLYIARPSHRGKGIGYSLWQHAIQHAGTRTIGLDGVPDQQANYAASGFRADGGTTRFSGRVSPARDDTLRRAEASDIPTLIDLEAEASGVEKARYLSTWFSNTDYRMTFVADDGFCTVRRCRAGAKIGPLVATSPTTALRLIHHAGKVIAPEVMIDVPAQSGELTTICHELGLAPGFETARMYRGTPPLAKGSLFAVTSLELG
ncbi:MAG: GNAT family N-acetyltransferase [Pseudomonadota bacterium]